MEDFGISRDKLECLRQVEIQTVDPEVLIDLRDIKIDQELTKEQRIAEFISQVKNPYCFKVGNIAIGVSYSDNEASFQQRLEHYLQTL